MATAAVADAPAQQALVLPALREDLMVQEGARDLDGHRTWTLFDPLRNRFFQLTERDFNLLGCWSAGDPEPVLAAMAQRHLAVDADDLAAFVEFLVRAELVVAAPGLRQRLQRLAQARERGLMQRVLHAYLSFRVPLVHPDRLLNWLYPRLQFLFSYAFLRVSLVCGLIGLVMIARQWDTFLASFDWFFKPGNLLVFMVVLAGIKILHEFGHALMSRHFGLRVPTMGVAFLVMWPVLYTDSSDAWRLRSPRQRALISVAGVLTETLLVCYAMLAWAFVPDGMLRSILFSVITTVWVTSLLVNFNPVMRFDGYYFCSDLMNFPNLQDRSFALARWQLRRWLLGVEVPPPEQFRPRLHRFLVGFAFFTWIYRFILFLGIALLVYHFFFKALGIFLFAVEIWWFILRPIVAELRQWQGSWSNMKLTRRRVLGGLAGGLALLLVFPWRADLALPAVLADAQVARVFPARDSRVEAIHVREGQVVAAGQLLVSLASPELESGLRRARIQLAALESARDRYATGSGEDRLVLEQAILRSRSELVALELERDRLMVRAAFPGRVRDLAINLHVGRWMSRDSKVLTLVGGAVKVTAWIDERDLAFLPERAEGRFYPERPLGAAMVPVALLPAERAATVVLDNPWQASLYGGGLPVRPDEDGRLVPEVGLYQLEFQATAPELASPDRMMRGEVMVEGRRRTLLGQGLRLLLGVLLRESGF